MIQDFSERLVINSDLKHLYLARYFIREVVRKINLAMSDENKIILATDEALSNVIQHAYELNKNGYIDINVSVTSQKFQIHIINNGKNFDPDKIKNNDINEHIKQGKKGGLGIFLMRRVMDELKYSFKDGQNHLTLIKYLFKME